MTYSYDRRGARKTREELQRQKELESTAYRMGQEAHRKGLQSAPALNREFKEFLAEAQLGISKESIAVLKAYSKGWTAANLRTAQGIPPGVPLSPFRETPGLCGPASLKVALSAFGINKSEAELTALSGANPNEGVDHAGLARAARAVGCKVYEKNGASLLDVKALTDKGIPVVVGFWDKDVVAPGTRPGEHYSVVRDVDDGLVYLLDPQLDGGEGKRTMPLKDFQRCWFDSDAAHWMLGVCAG